MEGILKIGKMVFVRTSESDKYIEQYRAEIADRSYLFKIDKTSFAPYYELFFCWKENKREWRDRIFATSTLPKMYDYIEKL